MFIIQTGVDRLIARVAGPMHARLVIQPLVAICLGIRDGIADAKAGAPPFLLDLIFQPDNRAERLKNALRRMLVPLIVAVVLDVIVQYMIFDRVRPLGAVLFGVCLMGIPYSLARGIANRIVSQRITKHKMAASSGM